MENKKMMVGIVIVNYNGEKFQNECLRTIMQQTYKNFRIIIVDSGSTDCSLEKVKDEFGKEVVILEQQYNCGIAKGNNIGIQYAIENGCDYVLLLNNDVELSADMLQCLVENASESVITVPKIYFYDNPNIIWMAGGKMDWKRGEARHIGIWEEDHGQYDKISQIDYAPTCAMLIHKSVFGKVGLEDETVFMYWDDTDLCVRMIEAGYTIKYIPYARMWHKVSSSSGGEKSKIFVYYCNRNQLYFLNKYNEKLKFYTKGYVKIKAFLKWALSPVRNKADKYIRLAYSDYKKGIMGRKDSL